MSGKTHIRTFKSNDAEPVVELWRKAAVSRPWLDLRSEIVEKRRRDRSLFLVADHGGSIIGAVMGAYDGRRGWVYHLAVDPDYQHGGIGRRLMQELERRMVAIGVGKVNLQVRHDNLAVIGFYAALGYEDSKVTSMEKWLEDSKGS